MSKHKSEDYKLSVFKYYLIIICILFEFQFL